jgi:pentatricopeptide repeat protein
VNVFDWTMAFSSAARQWKTSSEQLIRLFNRTFEIAHFRPTVATYTVLLRGLIMRRSYYDAADVWDRFLAERLVLDRKALGAGVKALTLAEQPLRAFDVLETFGARPGTAPASNAHVRQGARPWRMMKLDGRAPQQPVQVDTMTMNDFMVALLRIQRPDVVFKLWDHMETLYNVKPDSHTLETLCRAARLAAKLDSQSLAAMMRLSNPFRKPQVEPTTREEIVQTLERLLNKRDSRVARGIWRNAPAVDGVRNAFQELIFGNWPEMRNITSPAHAVRHPDSTDTPFSPFREVAQSISQSLSSKNIHTHNDREPPPHITFASRTPSYSSIVPSESAFCAYILLLGTSSYQHEIPLVLAWMRALRVHPRRRTLCFALIFWAEVSLRGPIFEEWAEKNERSEYGRLWRWIRDWVGDRNVPRDYMIAHFVKVVAQARDSRRRVHSSDRRSIRGPRFIVS